MFESSLSHVCESSLSHTWVIFKTPTPRHPSNVGAFVTKLSLAKAKELHMGSLLHVPVPSFLFSFLKRFLPWKMMQSLTWSAFALLFLSSAASAERFKLEANVLLCYAGQYSVQPQDWFVQDEHVCFICQRYHVLVSKKTSNKKHNGSISFLKWHWEFCTPLMNRNLLSKR